MHMKLNRRSPINRSIRRAVLAGDMLAVLLERVNIHNFADFVAAIGHVLNAWELAKEDLRGHVMPTLGTQSPLAPFSVAAPYMPPAHGPEVFGDWTDGEDGSRLPESAEAAAAPPEAAPPDTGPAAIMQRMAEQLAGGCRVGYPMADAQGRN